MPNETLEFPGGQAYLTTGEGVSVSKIVMMESPYSGKDLPLLYLLDKPFYQRRKVLISYARACLLDCIERGETPIATHLLYTQVLNDDNNELRASGLTLHSNLMSVIDKVVIYEDFGISSGMQKAVDEADELGKEIEYRKLKRTPNIRLPFEWRT